MKKVLPATALMLLMSAPLWAAKPQAPQPVVPASENTNSRAEEQSGREAANNQRQTSPAPALPSAAARVEEGSTPNGNASASAPTGNAAATAPAASSANPAASARTDAGSPAGNSNGTSATAITPSPTAANPLTSTYLIGVGDVLDIRLLNNANSRESTLFTVLTGGFIEYPLIGDPLSVTGLTTDEIRAKLVSELQRRAVYDQPQVAVTVRDYSSHTVMVSGLVNMPGAKILRREAVPLYVVLAEAQPRPEAGLATIVARANGRSTTVNLSDQAAMNTLVHSGDVVTIAARPPQFFYIGGQVNTPGQRDFHAGMTLTQAIFASGGPARFAGSRVRVMRQGTDGRLITTEHNLREIENGRVPDPPIQPGDRIEVMRGRW